MSKPINPWKISACLLLLLLACTVLLGAYRRTEPSTKTIEAEEFILKDSSGQTRARLGMDHDNAKIEFYDQNGKLITSMPNRGLKEVEAH